MGFCHYILLEAAVFLANPYVVIGSWYFIHPEIIEIPWTLPLSEPDTLAIFLHDPFIQVDQDLHRPLKDSVGEQANNGEEQREHVKKYEQLGSASKN